MCWKCPCLRCVTPKGPVPSSAGGWRSNAYGVLFGERIMSRRSVAINVAFIVVILTSVLVVLADSVPSVKETSGPVLNYVELTFSLIFSAEYLVRLMCVRDCWVYMVSFMGVVDLLSAVPPLFALLYSPLGTFVLLRILKVSRIFRLFKSGGIFRAYTELLYNVEKNVLKMVVFIIGFWSISIILGGFMYLLETENEGFDNIFKAIYWAIVTLTTVGYGDAVPETAFGKLLASVTVTLGYTFVVLGLRNQIPLPAVHRSRATRVVTDNNTNPSPQSAYVTMGNEISLDDEDTGVEMQVPRSLEPHISDTEDENNGTTQKNPPGQMLSFPENDDHLAQTLVQSLVPSGASYRHADDSEAINDTKVSETVSEEKRYNHSL